MRGINAKGAADKYSRKGIDELTEFVTTQSDAKGLAWFKVGEGSKLASPIAKNFDEALLAKFVDRMQAEPGDLLFFVADAYEVTCEALHRLRRRLGAELELYDAKQMHCSWVTEFPMFAKDEETDGWGGHASPLHRPACRRPGTAQGPTRPSAGHRLTIW